jgi:hypothetical protein
MEIIISKILQTIRKHSKHNKVYIFTIERKRITGRVPSERTVENPSRCRKLFHIAKKNSKRRKLWSGNSGEGVRACKWSTSWSFVSNSWPNIWSQREIFYRWVVGRERTNWSGIGFV